MTFTARTVCKAALLAGVLALSVPGALADELSLAHFMSPKHPMHDKVFAPVAEALSDRTGGDLTIRIFPGGELGKGPVQQYDRALNRVADIAFGLHGYTSPRFPRTLLVELPGISDGPVDATEGLWRAKDLLAPDYEQVHLLGMWANDKAVLIMRDTPVRAPADLADKVIRVPSAYAARVVEAWGGTPRQMPVPSVYGAMEKGDIDGVFIGASGIRSFKLFEVGNHLTTGMAPTVAGFYLVMNKDAWTELSDEHKAALSEVTGKSMSLEAARVYAAAGKAGLQAFADAGKEIIELTPEQARPFDKAAEAVMADVVAAQEDEGIPAGEIVAAIRSK